MQHRATHFQIALSWHPEILSRKPLIYGFELLTHINYLSAHKKKRKHFPPRDFHFLIMKQKKSLFMIVSSMKRLTSDSILSGVSHPYFSRVVFNFYVDYSSTVASELQTGAFMSTATTSARQTMLQRWE